MIRIHSNGVLRSSVGMLTLLNASSSPDHRTTKRPVPLVRLMSKAADALGRNFINRRRRRILEVAENRCTRRRERCSLDTQGGNMQTAVVRVVGAARPTYVRQYTMATMAARGPLVESSQHYVVIAPSSCWCFKRLLYDALLWHCPSHGVYLNVLWQCW